jgi:glycerol uptake facilitator-like aquaporin
MVSRVHASAVVTEFIGTFTLVLAFLTVSKSSLNLPFFTSLTAGLAVLAVMLVLGRISAAQLNPAITLGLLSIKRVTALRASAYIVAQLVGGITAYYLFAYFSGQRWHNTGQFEMKLLVAEIIGAFLLSLGWASIVFQKLDATKAAVVVGFSFTVALLAVSSAGVVTLNPAVALGLRSWVWGSAVLGPILGAILGFQLYKYLFVPEPTRAKESVVEEPMAKAVDSRLQRSKRIS